MPPFSSASVTQTERRVASGHSFSSMWSTPRISLHVKGPTACGGCSSTRACVAGHLEGRTGGAAPAEEFERYDPIVIPIYSLEKAEPHAAKLWPQAHKALVQACCESLHLRMRECSGADQDFEWRDRKLYYRCESPNRPFRAQLGISKRTWLCKKLYTICTATSLANFT